MPISQEDRAFFASILPASEMIDAQSPNFKVHTVPWSLSYDLFPTLALVPSSIATLSKLVKYIYEHESIDFVIRGTGVGSASARDVVLSMRNFAEVRFDPASEIVDIGAGLTWGEVDERLATLAPGHVVVGARCPYVGVTGSTLSGGLSWLSHELGLGSDPTNFLDAHIILQDGRTIWASTEPELMWALRGGGGNFGVVTTLRLRAYSAPTTVFAGTLMFSPSAVKTLSKRLSHWVHNHSSPKTALHIFVFDFSAQELHGDKEPTIVAIIWDALGEQHARESEEGFRWLFTAEGLEKEDVSAMTLSEVHDLQRSTERSHGTANSWLQAPLVDDNAFDEEFLERTWEWYQNVTREAPELAMGTFALVEIMQKPAFNTAGGRDRTAWPHGGKGRQHVLQMSVGAMAPLERGELNEPDLKVLRERAFDLLSRGTAQITRKEVHHPGDFLPNFQLDYHDPGAIYAENWDRLREIKRIYDPKGLFGRGAGFVPPGAEVKTTS